MAGTPIELRNYTGSAANPHAIIMNSGVADWRGTKWVIRSLDGWGGPDPHLNIVKRQGNHGMVVTTSSYGARFINIGGIAICTSAMNMWNSQLDLQTVTTTTSGNGKVIVHNTPHVRHALVRLHNAVRVSITSYKSFGFTIQYVAPDPFLKVGV